MDTSERNIKRCEKAVEIQLLAPERANHMIFDRGTKVFTDICGEWWAERPDWKKGIDPFWLDEDQYFVLDPEWVWLPRQDELQGMSGFYWQDFDIKCVSGYDECLTKEQAGMGLVMSHKYNRVWEDGGWVQEW